MGSWFVLCILFHAFSSEVAVTLADDTVYAWDQAAKVVTSDGSTNDYFGLRVSGLSSSSFVAGAYGDDDNGSKSGSVYVFTRSSSSSWVQSAKVVASDGGAFDYMGYSMADLNSNSFVVGAYGDDDMGSDSGSAYVFTQNDSGTWVQSAKILPSDGAAGDEFTMTTAVGLSDSAFATSSIYDDDNGADTGSVYVFTSSGGSWVQDGKITQSDGNSTYFGYAVAKLSSLSVAVGSPDDDNQSGASSGSAYVFTRSNDGSWAQADKFESSDGASSDDFAATMSGLSSSRLVVGAPYHDGGGTNRGSAYVFTSSNSGSWVQSAKVVASDAAALDQFSISLSGLTSSCFVSGAWLDGDMGSNSGSVYVFTSSDVGSWVQAYKVVASDGAAGDRFGYNVAGLSSYTFIVGSWQDDDLGSSSGSVYVFTDSGYTQSPTIAPTLAPTLTPTIVPTKAPTEGPTLTPTVAPTIVPTFHPTKVPTGSPTIAPTVIPSLQPTIAPTSLPTQVPTMVPTSNSSIPPPKLVGASFATSGTTVLAAFDRATDLGGLDWAFDCGALLNFTGGAEGCAWTSDSEVTITLGSESTLVPGDIVALLPGVLKSACATDFEYSCSNLTYALYQETIVAKPVSPVTPVVVAYYASKVSKCSDSEMDVSGSLGSGGRAFRFFWRMQNNSVPYPENLVALVAQTNGSVLSIPNNQLTPGTTYNLTVTLCNFLGGNASKELSFYVSTEAIPSLLLSAPSSIYVYDSLEVMAEAEATICNDSTTVSSTLSYTWKVLGESEIVSTSANPTLFKTGAYSFKSLQTYVIRATVTDSLGFQNSEDVSVNVKQGELLAILVGGDRTIGTGASFVINGQASTDLDSSNGNTSGVSFHWWSSGSVDFDLANLSSDGALVTFGADDLTNSDYYRFVLQLEKEGRVSNNVSVFVDIADEALPECDITYFSTGKVNSNSKLVITSSVVTGIAMAGTATWSLGEAGQSFFATSTSLEAAALSELTLELKKSSDAVFNLVVGADELISGSTYVFQLEASYQNATRSGMAVISIEVNTPPSSGVVKASPSSGTALQDTFEVEAFDWADDADDLPLAYRFFYGAGADECGEGDTRLLQAKTSLNKASALFLPPGNLSAGAEVLDRYGAEGYACSPVEVNELAVDSSELEALVETICNAAVKSSDPVSVLNVAAIGATMYNKSSSAATKFQYKLLSFLSNATSLLDADQDSTDRLAASLLDSLYISKDLDQVILSQALNLTGTAVGMGETLGSLSTDAAEDLADVLGAVLVEPMTAGSKDAAQLIEMVDDLNEVLAADLVEGEAASQLVSQDGKIALTVGKFSAATLASQLIATAAIKGSNKTVSTLLLNASSTLTIALTEFSTNVVFPVHTTTNGSSAQLSNVLRLGISGTARALTSFELVLQFNNPINFVSRMTSDAQFSCINGTEILNYTCNNENYIYKCAGQIGSFNYSCSSASSIPSCGVYNGTGWDSNLCTVLGYNSTSVSCMCPEKSYASRRRLTVCNSDNNCKDAEAFEVDLVANVEDIGSEIIGNFALADDIFTDTSLVKENYIVFTTMGSILVGIPLLAVMSHFIHRHQAKHKSSRNSRNEANASNDGTNDSLLALFQELEEMKVAKVHDVIIDNNEYLKLFVTGDGYTRAVTVVQVMLALFTIMFWDCTIFAVVFAPGYSDCYFISGQSECLSSELNCGWDPYSQGCAPYSLEDTPLTMIYVSALTLAITIPILAILACFTSKTIQIPVPEHDTPLPQTSSPLQHSRNNSQILKTGPSPTSEHQVEGKLLDGESGIVFRTDSHHSLIIRSSGNSESSQSSRNSPRVAIRKYLLMPYSEDSFMLSSRNLLGSQPIHDESEVKAMFDLRMQHLELDKQLLRALGFHWLVQRAVRRDVMKTLNLKVCLERASGNLQYQEELLVEAAWCQSMGDRVVLIFKRVVLGRSSEAGCCDNLIPVHSRRTAVRRRLLGWVCAIAYCTICAWYICLFGVNYGEDYTVGWLKAFAVGFFEDLLLLSPLLTLTVSFLGRFISWQPSLKQLRTLAQRRDRSESAAVFAARHYPELVISKVLLDPNFVPPSSWIKRYHIKKDDDNHDGESLAASLWKTGRFLFRVLGALLFLTVIIFLSLPTDLQGVLVEGMGVLALYYGAAYCLSNGSAGRRGGSTYAIVALLAIYLAFLWTYVMLPRKHLLKLWRSCITILNKNEEQHLHPEEKVEQIERRPPRRPPLKTTTKMTNATDMVSGPGKASAQEQGSQAERKDLIKTLSCGFFEQGGEVEHL